MNDSCDKSIKYVKLSAEKMMDALNVVAEGSLGTFDDKKLNVLECWDQKGYVNPIHVDSKKKIWTAVLYLFGDGDLTVGGTSLYEETNSEGEELTEFYVVNPKVNSAICANLSFFLQKDN